jgi:hypothetical protein
MSILGPTPGHLLYLRWCGSETSDRARYWGLMNPADRLAWERIGEDMRHIDAERGAAVRRVRALRNHLMIIIYTWTGGAKRQAEVAIVKDDVQAERDRVRLGGGD